MPKLVFGPAVEGWLKSEGLKAFTAQERLGATDSTINNWIAGKALPPSTRIRALSAALGIEEQALRVMVAKDRKARARRPLAGVGRGHARHSTGSVRR